MIKDVTDLEIYQLALELLDPVYLLANLLPQDHRKLTDFYLLGSDLIN